MKVRFEFEVDKEIESMSGCPMTTDEMFRDATGKSFLLQDPITKAYVFVYCERGITEDSKYAQFTSFPLPTNAEIVEECAKTDADPIAEIKSCIDEKTELIRDEMREHLNTSIQAITEKVLDFVGAGISEKTLLEALRIVTRTKEE